MEFLSVEAFQASPLSFFGYNFRHMPEQAKKENLLINLIFNIAAPVLILSKLSTEEHLGPVLGLILALAFPLGYFIWDYIRRRETNLVSVIGFVSVLLTGGLGLLKVSNFWFAVKEAAVPTVIGTVLFFSLKSEKSLMKTLFFNEQVINVPKINAALDERGTRSDFDQLFYRCGVWISLSFLLSAVLNYFLARYLLQSPPGTPEFNAELARMNLLSWPVIVLPSMVITLFAFWKLFSGISKLSGLEMEEVVHTKSSAKGN